MIEELVDWVEVVCIIAKKTGINKSEICRNAGMAGAVMTGLISPSRRLEPRHSEGVNLLEQYRLATQDDKPPMRTKKAKSYCASCQQTMPVISLFRVSEQAAKCMPCIAEIRRNTNLKNRK